MYANVLPSEKAPPAGLAAVRARGRIEVTALGRGQQSVRGDVHESGALRVRFPREHLQRLDASIVNVAGGMTGGDRFDMAFAAQDGASLFVSSTAAEKIYKSGGGETLVTTHLRAEAGSTLVWAPQETIVFNQSRLRRSLCADIATDAAFVACEMVIFGRTAMREAMTDMSWRERWRIRRNGRLVLAEDMAISGDGDAHLARAAIGAGAHCFATLVYIGPRHDEVADAIRHQEQPQGCETGVSTLDSLAVVRFAAVHGAALRAATMAALALTPAAPLPRSWHT